MKKKLKFTIAMPTFNGQKWIKQAIDSILNQSFQDFEIIISDDNSWDNTIKIIKNIKDKRIKIYQNSKNLGYGKNLQVLKKLVKADVLFLMAQDDILLKNALLKTYQAFYLDKDIGVVTRPYFWFYQNIKKPVRAITPFNKDKSVVTSIFAGKKVVQKIFESVGQLSGLAYKTEYFNLNFHQETFVAHIYPLAEILKKHKIVFLKDYTVAVRIPSSQTRHKSDIYNISPALSWVKMFQTIFQEKKYYKIKQTGIKQITTHFLGLIQIKNFGSFKNLIEEVFILIKFNPLNLLNIKFWFFSLAIILIPKNILLWLTDNYKNKVMARKFKDIKIRLS